MIGLVFQTAIQIIVVVGQVVGLLTAMVLKGLGWFVGWAWQRFKNRKQQNSAVPPTVPPPAPTTGPIAATGSTHPTTSGVVRLAPRPLHPRVPMPPLSSSAMGRKSR